MADARVDESESVFLSPQLLLQHLVGNVNDLHDDLLFINFNALYLDVNLLGVRL